MLQNLKTQTRRQLYAVGGFVLLERVAGVFTKLRGVGCDAFKFHFGFSHLFLMHPARFPPRVTLPRVSLSFHVARDSFDPTAKTLLRHKKAIRPTPSQSQICRFQSAIILFSCFLISRGGRPAARFILRIF